MRNVTLVCGIVLSLLAMACVMDVDDHELSEEQLAGIVTSPEVDKGIATTPEEKGLVTSPEQVSSPDGGGEADIVSPVCDDPYGYCEPDMPGGGGGGTGGGGGGGSGGTPTGSCPAGWRFMDRYRQCVYRGQPCNGLCDEATEGVCTINVNYICECSGGTGC